MSELSALTVLEGHTGAIESLSFSLDGGALATAAQDGTVRVWNVRHGDSKTILTGQRGPTTVALSRSGTFLAIASAHDDTALCNVAECLTAASVERRGTRIALAPLSGREGIALVRGSHVFLWDAPRNTIIALTARFKNDELYYPEAIAVSPDGGTVATGSMSMSWERGALTPFESVRLWDVSSSHLRTTLPPSPPIGILAFSPNGRLLAGGQGSQEAPHEVHVWDVESSQPFAKIPAPPLSSRVEAIAFSADSRFLAIGVTKSRSATGRIVVIDTASTGHNGSALSLPAPVTRLALSPDAQYAASAGGRGDYSVRIWQLVL